MMAKKETCFALFMALLLILVLSGCEAVAPALSPTPVSITAETPTATPALTPTATSTSTPLPTSTPAAVTRSLKPEDVLALSEVPRDIRAIAYLLAQKRSISAENEEKFKRWLIEYEYQNAPAEVLETWRRLSEGQSVAEEAIAEHNQWVEEHNAAVAAQATATAVAKATAEARATATMEAIVAKASQGVECGKLPASETRLTSPVARYLAISAGDYARFPLGSLRRDLPPTIVTAFHLEPETNIYAPISGKLLMGGGLSWRKTLYTVLFIETRDMTVYLILPTFWHPPDMHPDRVSEFITEYEACMDCVEFFGIQRIEEMDERGCITGQWGRPWVNRGERVARYHKGKLPVDGFSASLVVYAGTPEKVLNLGLDAPHNSLWYGGYPTVCQEWR